MQKDFAVGQTWRTRDGELAVIKGVAGGPGDFYPIEGEIEGAYETWTREGRCFATAMLGGDLVERVVVQPSDQALEDIRADVAATLERAAARGVVVTVEQRPLQPFAMGHYETVVSVRMARGLSC